MSGKGRAPVMRVHGLRMMRGMVMCGGGRALRDSEPGRRSMRRSDMDCPRLDCPRMDCPRMGGVEGLREPRGGGRAAHDRPFQHGEGKRGKDQHKAGASERRAKPPAPASRLASRLESCPLHPHEDMLARQSWLGDGE
jgi:hypothetical protein